MAKPDVEFERERRDVHNFIDEFIKPIIKLEPLFAQGAKAKEFLASYDTTVVEKQMKLADLDSKITTATEHLAEISPKANEARLAAERALEADLKHRETVAMEPIQARVTMAENTAKVLEERIVGLERHEANLNQFILERQSVLDDVNEKIADFYKSLPERKVS